VTSDLLLAALERVVPIIAFLLAVTLCAELADRAGVFDVAGHWIARQGRHRLWLLWLLFALFAVTCTVFLSLDTTAVLLTPVALAIARQIGASPRPFALTTLWIANTGSLLLPVSNLTNLLAMHEFEAMGIDHLGYVRLALVPGLVAIAVTLAVIVALHWRDLFSSYAVDPPSAPHDRVLLRLAMVTCLLVGPAFAVGLPPWAVASVAAAALVVATGWRARSLLRGLSLPWVMAGGFALLTVIVSWAHDSGHLTWLTQAAGTGSGVGDLLRVTGVSAMTSNVANNLPAYLALEPAGAGSPVRLLAILIGANVGPLVTPWASLATLLWLQRCRARGVQWRLWRLALGGLACAGAAVVASTVALALA
jgi:arsenical pump membrane protein